MTDAAAREAHDRSFRASESERPELITPSSTDKKAVDFSFLKRTTRAKVRLRRFSDPEIHYCINVHWIIGNLDCAVEFVLVTRSSPRPGSGAEIFLAAKH